MRITVRPSGKGVVRTRSTEHGARNTERGAQSGIELRPERPPLPPVPGRRGNGRRGTTAVTAAAAPRPAMTGGSAPLAAAGRGLCGWPVRAVSWEFASCSWVKQVRCQPCGEWDATRFRGVIQTRSPVPVPTWHSPACGCCLIVSSPWYCRVTGPVKPISGQTICQTRTGGDRCPETCRSSYSPPC